MISPLGLPLLRRATKIKMNPATLKARAINIRARCTCTNKEASKNVAFHRKYILYIYDPVYILYILQRGAALALRAYVHVLYVHQQRTHCSSDYTDRCSPETRLLQALQASCRQQRSRQWEPARSKQRTLGFLCEYRNNHYSINHRDSNHNFLLFL